MPGRFEAKGRTLPRRSGDGRVSMIRKSRGKQRAGPWSQAPIAHAPNERYLSLLRLPTAPGCTGTNEKLGTSSFRRQLSDRHHLPTHMYVGLRKQSTIVVVKPVTENHQSRGTDVRPGAGS